MRKPSRIRALAGMTATIGLVLAAAGPAAAGTDSAAATTYYVDCSAGSDTAAGTSAATAWQSLARVNSVQLRPGDTVRLRGGVTCAGTLAPQGSGTSARPVTLASYGHGKAKIDGQGATAAVFLHNVQGYVLCNLDVSNTGPAPTPGQQRTGVYVLLEDYGTGSHYRLQNLNVHDVNGSDSRYPTPSGGIVVEAGGSTVPTGFDDVRITSNTVNHVDRTGIALVSSWQRRANNPTGPGTSFVPLTRVVVRANTLTDLGGDGILVFNGKAPLVERNVINGYNERSADYNVGAYPWNSDDAVFQYNDVSHGVSPAMAFDFEGGNQNPVYQYNFSHDNGGGALFSCPSQGTNSSGGIYRYNISQNDVGAGYLGVITLLCGDEPGSQIYNNTFYDPTTPNMVMASGASTFRFTNNIFVGRPGGSVLNDPLSTYSYNDYQNVTGAGPAATPALQGNPLFVAPGNATSINNATGYELAAGSPALGSGTPVAPSGAHDYFGNPVPSAGLNVGAYQGAGSGS
ncbi:right-handed parallel beta-helix repeat-containing protein [Kitasatospora sp. MAP5-34]|uniref:right-handed parallel beta-helix repeat-containing protein n=1 Tax=Kitasatospora sp. MAP5-34 TaxID=3035102 RepID=UPI0024771903|nr:right-handed parallel beta-helix repeat-containing protein [Kitasatospora sp. MAP5-34]MDH6579833.1 hypothetical protein [Kitasatospora sp. MAP5-34]